MCVIFFICLTQARSRWWYHIEEVSQCRQGEREIPEAKSGQFVLLIHVSVYFILFNFFSIDIIEDASAEGLFRRSGRRELRQKILSALKKGETLNFQHGNGALECAAALQLFLSRLKRPVVPFNIQQLILGIFKDIFLFI